MAKKFIVNTEITDSEKLKIKENRPIELSGLEILINSILW